MEFRTLHLEDKAAINDILLPLGRNDSALGFANLYSLTEKYGTQIALEEMCIRDRNKASGEHDAARKPGNDAGIRSARADERSGEQQQALP